MQDLAPLLIVPLLTSFISVYVISKIRCSRLLAPDVHKPYKVYVPKIGGVCLLTSTIALILYILTTDAVTRSVVYTLYIPVLVIGLVGLLDDLLNIKPLWRVLLTVIVASIVTFLLTTPRGELLIVGHIRNQVILLLIACLCVVIFSNAVNMLDVMNGIVPISTCMICATLAVICLVYGMADYALLYLIALLQILPLALYNRYPARVFNGNVGSYTIGAYLGLLAVHTGTYAELTLASIPYIINGLLVLASTRGRAFLGRSRLSRPILCKDGILVPNLEERCPLTLARIAVLLSCNTEREVVNFIIKLFALSCLITLCIVVILKYMFT